MIHNGQLRQYIIKPTLEAINSYSENAEELLVFTCAAESLGGYLIHQIKGPALGIFQMEPATHHDIWRNFIFLKPALATMMSKNLSISTIPDESRLTHDLNYATTMTRIHYLRVKQGLPKKNDVEGMWNYYKQYYNTHLGKAKKDEAIEKYRKYGKA